MMNKLTLLTLFLFLAACSSDPSKPSDDTAGNKTSSKAAISEAPPVMKDVSEPGEKAKPVPAAPSQYDALNQAIKSQSDEAIYNSATQILTQSPTDMKALNAMAMYNYKKGRFEVSRYLLAKAIAAYPHSNELQSNLGIVLLAQNERRDAVKAFRRALELDNSDAVASANLGAIYVQEKDYTKARVVLETAYNKGLRDPRILNNYGIALTAAGKYDKAEDIYKAALKDQSNNKDVMLNYAILLIDNLNKYQDGLDLVNRLKFVGVSPESRSRIIALENKAKAGVK